MTFADHLKALALLDAALHRANNTPVYGKLISTRDLLTRKMWRMEG